MNIKDLRDWQEFCQGENSAMERLYTRNSSALFSFCLFLCGDRAKSEEIVQDSFLRLIEQQNKLKVIKSVRGWLFVTARNLVYNHSRKNSDQSLDNLPEDYLVKDSNNEIKLRVSRILSALNPDDRELLLLREHQGFSIREIAQMLELSGENVRVRLHRIRKRIQTTKGL